MFLHFLTSLHTCRLVAPEEGWDFDFFCSFPKTDGKRKSSDLLESSTYKTKRMDVFRKCSDLIVLGLPWKTTEEELKDHFSVYGDVIMSQVSFCPVANIPVEFCCSLFIIRIPLIASIC